MNFAASGPTTSILPSVEASNRPAALRTVTHSRLTAACMSSPAFGKYQARFHWPTSSNTAPWASAQGWIAVLRVGSNSGPRRMVDDRPEGDRRIGRAEGREPDLRDVLAQRLGGDGQAVHVGGLALVGRHAVGGEALDVLDRAHAFAHGQPDVLGGDVVLEIDEGLHRRVRRRRRVPRRACRRPSSRPSRPSSLRALAGLAAGILRRLLAGRIALRRSSRQGRRCRCRRRPTRSPAHRCRAGSAWSRRRRRPCRATARTDAPTASSRPTSGCASTGMVRSRAAGLRPARSSTTRAACRRRG